MKIPATAGKMLTEERLRAYAKCSEFYNFGGVVKEERNCEALRSLCESVFISQLKFPEKAPIDHIALNIVKTVSRIGRRDHLMEGEIEALSNSIVLEAAELLKIFPLKQYNLVTGPLRYQYKVSKTPIDLSVSATLRSNKNQTLHLITFSPFVSDIDLVNDPVSHAKLHSIKHLVEKPIGFNKRPTAKLHTFSLTEKNKLHYSSLDSHESSDEWLDRLTTLIKTIETGHHYPVVPCYYRCKFKSTCFPKKKNEVQRNLREDRDVKTAFPLGG